MTLQIRCGNCSKLLKVADSLVGKRVKCPGCGSLVIVPAKPVSAPSISAHASATSRRSGKTIGIAGGIAVVVIAGAIGLWAMNRGESAAKRGTGPASLPPEQMTLTMKDGSTYSIVATKLVNPYVIQYHEAGYKYDMTQVTDVLDALASSAGRQPDLYRSLMDDGMLEEMQALDKKSGGKVFSTQMKNTPFPNPQEWQNLIHYWVDLERNGKTYRIAVGKDIIHGEATPPSMTTFVREGNRWLQSEDLDGTGIGFQLAFDSYDDLKKACAVPAKPGAP